ncbi:Cytochrome P450 [Cinnamomum micranthum f. kanehirae]|uniref:Cytochrome P450 n=1 Tax=Cinnamomum micranthum f. kanehirae TaxID=337451 RepID=A0A3S3QPD3_9MAGN|nr:Cytochrome P450 [Cinnamomum micranthum f. kanehirae]
MNKEGGEGRSKESVQGRKRWREGKKRREKGIKKRGGGGCGCAGEAARVVQQVGVCRWWRGCRVSAGGEEERVGGRRERKEKKRRKEEGLKQVLQKHDHVLAGRDVGDALRVLNYNNMSMAWSQPNQYWRKLRSISNTQMFTNQRLDSGQGLRRLKMQELLANMLEKSEMREAVDIGEAAFVAMINLISSTIFTLDLVDVDSGDRSWQ